MFSNLSTIGKYLFLVPFAGFGISHFMMADKMAGMVPIPGGVVWVYITGLAMLAFVASVLLGKYDKLAAVLLAALMLLMVMLIHIPGMSSNQMAMPSMLKDIGLAAGALMYAGSLSRDNSIIG